MKKKVVGERSKKVKITSTAQNPTSQVALVPVNPVFAKHRFRGDPKAGDSATAWRQRRLAIGLVELIQQLLARLLKRLRILFRGDSGCFVAALLDLLDSLGQKYLIQVRRKNRVQLLVGQAWQPLKRQPGWAQCEFHDAGRNWAVARRFVAVRLLKSSQKDSLQVDLWGLPPLAVFGKTKESNIITFGHSVQISILVRALSRGHLTS